MRRRRPPPSSTAGCPAGWPPASEPTAADTRQAFWSSIDAGHLDDAVELAVARSFLWRNAVGCVEGHRWLDALAGHDLEPRTGAWVALLRADIAQGDGDFLTMIAAAQEAARLAAGRDPEAEALARQFVALQHLLDPASADRGARRRAGDLA